MNQKQTRPHLIIPEVDIQQIPNAPTGRTEHVPRQFSEHGQQLLSGVEKVVNFSSNNLSSLEDMIAFKIKLHEGHKFSEKSKQEFLSSRNIQIKSVHTNEIAIVATSPQTVNQFKKYIQVYAQRGENKTYL